MKHRTEKGGWTKNQLEILGLTWPPKKGWQDKVIGKELSEALCINFISKRIRSLNRSIRN